MTNNTLEVLNRMARVDGEIGFCETDIAEDMSIGGLALNDADDVFRNTQGMKAVIRSQVQPEDIPEAWIERIESFPAVDEKSIFLKQSAVIRAWLSLIRISVNANSRYWGAGVAAAFALVVLVNPSLDEPRTSQLGSEIGASALSEYFRAGGELKAKTGLDEARREISTADGPTLEALQVGVPGVGISSEAVAESALQQDCNKIERATSILNEQTSTVISANKANRDCADSAVKERN